MNSTNGLAGAVHCFARLSWAPRNMATMKICFLGLENLPVLAPGFGKFSVGGAQVQQTLLARALEHAGHTVSMVVADYGQADGCGWDGIRTFKACAPDAGIPMLRFVYPRWTSIWSALGRADADLYYTSCAGMQVGLLAAFCRQHDKPFVFRVASDSDCDPSRVLVRLARDRWLYRWGLRRANAILVQSRHQASLLACHYELPSRRAGSMVETPERSNIARDIDLLFVGNIRSIKRPDLVIALAASFPELSVHMVGGPLPGEEAMYHATKRHAAALPNVVFHGRLPYADTNELYGRARVLVNTSDVEGFPNTYLQSWARGVPVVALFDPDGVIRRERLGIAADTLAELRDAVKALLGEPGAWAEASERCRAFMAREYGEASMLAPYIETFESIVDRGVEGSSPIAASEVHRV
jgi:glycosyltransferase involved in cell wall biosynthesis